MTAHATVDLKAASAGFTEVSVAQLLPKVALEPARDSNFIEERPLREWQHSNQVEQERPERLFKRAPCIRELL